MERPHLFVRPSMIPPLQRGGPFADGLEPGERVARLRALRAIVRLLTGPRGAALEAELRRAEMGRGWRQHAALDALASVDRRRVLTSYAGLNTIRTSDRTLNATP